VQPADEQSELLRYDSCHPEITFSVQGQKQEKQERHKQQETPHTYREDTHRKAPRWAFLGLGSIPPELDENDPAIMAVAPLVVDTHDGTCEILGR
jgi:hypothetical protein